MRVSFLNVHMDPSISWKYDCFIVLSITMQGTDGSEQYLGENSQEDIILRKGSVLEWAREGTRSQTNRVIHDV